MNLSIGEQAVFHCLFIAPNTNYSIIWFVNGTNIIMLTNNLTCAERGDVTQDESQGNIISTWTFSVLSDHWNHACVSCFALPTNTSQMDYKSEPKLLLIQGNLVKIIQKFIYIYLYTGMH